MRILLAHNSRYYPAHGGGDKSNRLLMEALAERGHACRVVARLSAFGPREHEQYLEELAARSIPVISSDPGMVEFRRRGVEVHVVTDNPHLRACFAVQIAEFAPAVILNSTDDPAQVLFEAALAAEAFRAEAPHVSISRAPPSPFRSGPTARSRAPQRPACCDRPMAWLG
jgi:hypothetical protein